MINRQLLLTALVGPEGAAALAKAAERLPEIDNAMAPRALFAWLSLAASGYAGEIPGVEGSHLALTKSETGFSGTVAVGGTDYDFVDASLLHVSAAVGALGGLGDHRVDSRVRDDDLYRLGRTVDILVKARAAHEALKKSDSEPDYTFEHEHDASQHPPVTTVYALKGDREVGRAVMVAHEGGHKIRSWTLDSAAHPTLEGRLQDVVRHITGSELNKADDEGDGDGATEGPGPAHKPSKPAGPLEPTPPSRQAQQPPKPRAKKLTPPKPTLTTIPGLNRLKLSEKQLSGKCGVCDGHQLQADVFVGCYCFRDLGRFVRMEKSESIVTLAFGEQWSEDAVLALLDSVKGGRDG